MSMGYLLLSKNVGWLIGFKKKPCCLQDLLPTRDHFRAKDTD